MSKSPKAFARSVVDLGKSIVGFFGDRQEEGARAVAVEAVRRATGAGRSVDAVSSTIAALGGTGASELFTLEDRTPLLVREPDGHGFIGGKTGSGKSVFGIFLLMLALPRILAGSLRTFYLDPKDATSFMRALACAYLRFPALRSRFRGAVHAIVARRGFVTPFSPLVASREVSDPYLAELISDILARTSRAILSGTVAEVIYHVIWLCIDVSIPLNIRFIGKFFRNARFQRRIIARVKARELRLYLETMNETVAKVTIGAAFRQFRRLLMFPENAYALGLPTEAIRSLGMTTDAELVIADCAPSNVIPPSIALMHAELLTTKVLLESKGRDNRVPLRIVLEELPRILDRSPQLTALVLDSLQTLRSANVNLIMCAQRLDSLDREVVRDIELNTSWMVAFQSRPDIGDLLAPYLQPIPGMSEADRRREFLRELGALPTQHAYFHVKGHVPLRVRSIDVTPPATAAGIPNDELDDVFFSEIVPRSTISTARAEALIADWEARFLGEDDDSAGTKESGSGGLASLQAFFEAEDDDE